MNNKVFISIILDTRRKKTNGTYPVKLRVFTNNPRKQKLYPTEFDLSEKDFESTWLTTKPRNEHKALRLKLSAIENKANEEAQKLEVFTFEKFEKRLFIQKGGMGTINFYFKQMTDTLRKEQRFGNLQFYELSLKSFINFSKSQNKSESIKFTDITPKWLEKYETYMTLQGRRTTTISMYVRCLRAIFNEALRENEFDKEYYPFGKNKYEIPSARNIKKALTADQLKLLYNAETKTDEQQKSKDFWFISYACFGMNFTDIEHLKYADIKDNVIEFVRAKTAKTKKKDIKPVRIPITDMIQQYIDKYGNKDKRTENYIFDIISKNATAEDNHKRIKAFIVTTNKNMKKIALANNMNLNLSTYVARHSFATNAIRKGASMEFVSEALSHNNLNTTQAYFKGFDDESKKSMMDLLTDF
ncbi:MAG: site-specific integrase [Cytophagales bacterium]